MKVSKVAVFASGNGSNLQAILDRVADGSIPAEIAVVVSDKGKAFALERARESKVEALHLSPKNYPSREAFDGYLLKAMQEREIDWVVLAGFMRILSPTFVHPFLGKVINIHPALLPKYPGTHSIQRAFEAGEREVGVTVHYVDEGVDTGPIIAQERIEVRKGESLEGLTERVHQLEHKIYPDVLQGLVVGTIDKFKVKR